MEELLMLMSGIIGLMVGWLSGREQGWAEGVIDAILFQQRAAETPPLPAPTDRPPASS